MRRANEAAAPRFPAKRARAAPTAAVLAAIAIGASLTSAEEIFVEGSITGFVARDIDSAGDGDATRELWVSYHEGGQRWLALFRAANGSYARTPSRTIAVDPQAVMFTLGDYSPAPGLELVLISRSSAIEYRYRETGAARGARLLRGDFFFHVPSPIALPFWPGGGVDLDADGRDDFLFPEKRGLRVLTKRVSAAGGDGSWGSETALPLQYYLLVDSGRIVLQNDLIAFAEPTAETPDLLESSAAFPLPVLRDFDGDGRLDVIAKQLGNRVSVFLQRESGELPTSPDVPLAFPWADKASSVILADVTRDGRLDAVVTRVLVSELSAEVRIFVQNPDALVASFQTPRQVLRMSGILRRPALGDVDGDGHADLLVASYRIDLLDQLREETVDELEISYEVYPSTPGPAPFAKRPAGRERFRLRTAGLAREEPRPSIYAGEDLTGDGLADVLFVDRGGQLRLHRALGGGVRYEEEREFAVRIGNPKEVRLVDLDGRAGREAVLRFERSLRIERFARGGNQ